MMVALEIPDDLLPYLAHMQGRYWSALNDPDDERPPAEPTIAETILALLEQGRDHWEYQQRQEAIDRMDPSRDPDSIPF